MNNLALRAALPFIAFPQRTLPFDPFDFRRHGPYPHQLDLLMRLVQAVEQGHRRILLQLPTGGGKTKIATALLASADQAQFIVHRKELIEQTSRAFWGAGVPHSFVAAGKPFDPDAALLIAGIATLAQKKNVVLPPEVVVWDECFVAGTLIDGKPIEQISLGDMVTAFNEQTGAFEQRRVVRLFKNKLRGNMVRLQVDKHHATCCTEGHPFWTQRGWVKAGDLTQEDFVLAYRSTLQRVWSDDGTHTEMEAGQPSAHRSRLLQQDVLNSFSEQGVVGDGECDKSTVRICAHESEQPDEQSSDSGSNGSNDACSEASTQGARWQRSASDQGRGETARDAGVHGLRSAVRSSNGYSMGGTPDTLQGGRGSSEVENCSGGGRALPQRCTASGTGCEERPVSYWCRVESVTVLKRDDLDGPTKGILGSVFDGYVYNFEVDGLHTYIANGLVVHNCHHLNAATWADVMAAYPDALHIGLTATPQRLDGQGLGDHFDVMICGPTPKWLIGEGYLSDFDFYGPPPADEDDNALLGDVVDHYLKHAPGQPGIVFASNRSHSRALATEFCRRGVRALHVDGSMSASQRERADKMFRSGEVTVEVNVNLFGEGYDIPGIVYCGIARRTQSLSWYLQMVGRALRPVYGDGYDLSTTQGRLDALMWGVKPKAIICDHGNNWFTHGMPDDDRAWTLDGRLRGSGPGCNADADPIHQCLVCYRVTPSFVKICPGCGTAFPTKTRNLRLRPGELQKIEREEARAEREAAKKAAERARKAEERACESHAEFIALHKKRSYDGDPRKWARMKMKFRSTWKQG